GSINLHAQSFYPGITPLCRVVEASGVKQIIHCCKLCLLHKWPLQNSSGALKTVIDQPRTQMCRLVQELLKAKSTYWGINDNFKDRIYSNW
ncbi:hypothetical protein BT69DRAFT_1211113, partial [Atractiella rhizophila]